MSSPCIQCHGKTKLGLRCKSRISCRQGCKKFCFRHAFKYQKNKECIDEKAKPKFLNCGALSSTTIGNGVEVRKSLIPNAGNGLFTMKPFLKGEAVTEYDGKVIDNNEAKQLRQIKKDRHIKTVDRNASHIDGLNKPILHRGGASFANDAMNNALYNTVFCKTEKVIHGLPDLRTGDKVLGRIFLRATRNIAAGEEIYVDYGKPTRQFFGIEK